MCLFFVIYPVGLVIYLIAALWYYFFTRYVVLLYLLFHTCLIVFHFTYVSNINVYNVSAAVRPYRICIVFVFCVRCYVLFLFV